ncbi:GDP-mannose 4,6-dehydratase [Candidatus Pacearchaeota archaeon]|nr:GDP-mannose 4,6-dehydratase [Candidatus Pacearchaeota archaeon]
MGYNLTDGLKSNLCTYEFKNFKMLFLIKQTTNQEFNITFDSDEKYYGYYSMNFLSLTDNLAKEDKVNELLSIDLSQREICGQTGISRTFIRNIQNGGHAQILHHLAKEKTEVKKILYHQQQPEWVFDIETDSGKFMAGVGNIVLSNSPRRGLNFATRKITREMARIVIGETSEIVMGNLDAKRDWGLSKEYVWAMWKILQHHEPDDFVIATEETHTVREFLEEAFSLLGLDYKDYVSVNEKYKRPAEVPALLGNASKAKKLLSWNPQVKFKDLVYMMVEADLKEQFEEKGIVPVDPQNRNKKGFYIAKAKEILKEKGMLQII